MVSGADHPEVLATRSYSPVPTSRLRPRRGNHHVPGHLTDRERVLGPDHPDTLTTRNNLAGAYRAVGHLAEAITLYEDILPTANESSDPTTLTL